MNYTLMHFFEYLLYSNAHFSVTSARRTPEQNKATGHDVVPPYIINSLDGLGKYSERMSSLGFIVIVDSIKEENDFASGKSEEFMVLNRSYEINKETLNLNQSVIKDLTTYIDPTKYNYIFADQSLDAMNFWVQIGVDWKARRMMSAKVMPNL